MSRIDLAWLEVSVRGFNGDAEATANDRLMHRVFGELDTSVAERVVLVDKLWATQMFRRSGAMARVIRSISAFGDEIGERCKSLPADALLHDPGLVSGVALEVLPRIMGLEGDYPGPVYRPYSFASKFLHWTAPDHFPIMDSRARAKINRMQRERGVRPRVAAGEGYWEADYPRWVYFFSEAIQGLSECERRRLVEIDFDSQPEAHRCRNTLVRILDKAFYWG